MTERIADEELLCRYVDGTLADHERQQLDTLLRQDADARELLREVALHAVVASDVVRMQGTEVATAPATSPARVRGFVSGRRWVGLALVAAVTMGVCVGLYWEQRQRSPQILQVKRIHGIVRWTGDGGRVTDRLVANQRLPGGTLESLSADSWIELQFRDHSTVTLAGRSIVTLSEQEQKEIYLRQGSLSADIQPQQVRRPMVVHTRTAEMQVLGTQFDVDVLSASTRLAVNEGRVRLKRLADGEQVEVSARHKVIASDESQTPLELLQRGSHVTEWKSDLKNDVKCGKWTSGLWQQAMRLKKAVALGEMTEKDAIADYVKAIKTTTAAHEDGSVWAQPSAFGGLIVLSVRDASDQPVILTDHATLRITGRVHALNDVEFGFTTSKPDGGFAGKYSVLIQGDSLWGDDKGFELALPVSEFPELTDIGMTPRGNELRDFWCVTKGKSVKLEITGVELVE